jgi:hypothetical protein
MAKTSSGQLFVKLPQLVAESTEGTTPTASPTFTSLGAVQSLGFNIDGNFVDISQIGVEDLIAILQGQQVFESSIKLHLINSTFIKRIMNAANYASPSGLISETFSLLFSVYLDGTENYVIMKGTRGKNITLSCEVGQPIECTVDFVHTDITTPASAHGLTTPAFASAPSGPVWGWLDGGTSPVTYGGTAIDAKSISLSINRNTNPDHTLGNLKPHSSQPHGRRIGGDVTGLWTGTVLANSKSLEGLHKVPETSATSLAWVLKSATSTVTVTDAKFVTYRRDADADDAQGQVEQAGIKGTAIAVT